jgi:hypothetical protein
MLHTVQEGAVERETAPQSSERSNQAASVGRSIFGPFRVREVPQICYLDAIRLGSPRMA